MKRSNCSNVQLGEGRFGELRAAFAGEQMEIFGRTAFGSRVCEGVGGPDNPQPPNQGLLSGFARKT